MERQGDCGAGPLQVLAPPAGAGCSSAVLPHWLTLPPSTSLQGSEASRDITFPDYTFWGHEYQYLQVGVMIPLGFTGAAAELVGS